MTSSKNTIWIAGTGVLAVLIVVASYFLLISPKRAEAAETTSAAAGVEQSNLSLAAETERLKAQFATIDDQRAQLAEIRAQLPSSSEVPALIRQFTGFATGTGVTVTDIAPGALTDYVGAVTAVAATTTDATGEAVPTPAGVGSGIQSMPVSVTVEGSFASTELFLKNLQADMRRYFLVEGVDLPREDANLSTSITGRIFVLADGSTTTATDSTTATTTDTTASATSNAAATSTGTVS